MAVLLDNTEAYPTPTMATFSVKWADVNYGAWDKFVQDRKLPPDTPEPACDILLSDLSLVAQRLARPRRDWTPRRKQMNVEHVVSEDIPLDD